MDEVVYEQSFSEKHPYLAMAGICLGSIAVALPACIGLGYLQAKLTAGCLGKEARQLLVEAGVNLAGQGR